MAPTLSTEEVLTRAYAAAPAHIQSYLSSGKLESFCLSLGQRFNIHADLLDQIARELVLTLLGLTNPKDLIVNLSVEAKVPSLLLSPVVEEMNKNIFEPLRQETKIGLEQTPQPSGASSVPHVPPSHETQWVSVAPQKTMPAQQSREPSLSVPAYTANQQQYTPPPVQTLPISVNMLQGGTPASPLPTQVHATVPETLPQTFATPTENQSPSSAQIPGAGVQEYPRVSTPVQSPPPQVFPSTQPPLTVAARTYVGNAAPASGSAAAVTPQERKIPAAYQAVVPSAVPSQPVQTQTYTRPYMPPANLQDHVPGNDPYREPI